MIAITSEQIQIKSRASSFKYPAMLWSLKMLIEPMTSVIKAGPVFEVLAENDFDDYTLSSPAVSDGQIFFRTSKFLYAVGRRAG